jgi:hypothetical protein
MGWREIRCPRCGKAVKIPWLWVLGLEMVFYCRECRQHLRINYKWGAVLTGIGWAGAFASIQLLSYFASKFTITLAAVAFLPLGFLYSFLLRRLALRHTKRTKSEK